MKKKKIIVKLIKSFININNKYNKNILFYKFSLKKKNIVKILINNYELKKNVNKIFFYLKFINLKNHE